MRARRALTWREHLGRQARRHAHIARIAIHGGDEPLALSALAISIGYLEQLARVKAGAA